MAVDLLKENGTSRDAHPEISGLLGCDATAVGEKKVEDNLVGRARCTVFMWPAFPMEDCVSQDIRVGVSISTR